MLRETRLSPRAACALVLAAAVCVALAVWRAAPSADAASPSTSSLQNQIDATKHRASGLSNAVSRASGRVKELSSSIAGLERQITSAQSSLVYERSQLLRTRAMITTAKHRLQQLEARENHAQHVLANRLVGTYETPPPDIVNVILEAHGFADMLERISFARKIQHQDAQVVAQVKTARSAVAEQATALGAIEVRQQTITMKIVGQRDRLDAARVKLAQQRLVAARQRAAAAGQLAGARHHVASLQAELNKVQAQQAAARQREQAQQSGATSSGSTSSGSSSTASPVTVHSAGGFTFPMPPSAASPPSTWSLDQGVDISAPAHTPELAVGSGTIVLHGIGGFGPWAPVLHLDSGGYVYYGHAGPGNQLPIGTHVSAGQVISEVGAGIVGISSGPHLEIGFCDASGTPLGSQTAPQMMSLLQASY
jgi:murein DD-endopeptidase MepM/ murein hydrolase activator NlpD